MSGVSTIRHDEVFPRPYRNYQMTIIGAGAIGSRIFASLVELGMKRVTVIDFDDVESHNLANQIFMNRDIGRPKVAGCLNFYRDKTGNAPDDNYKFLIDKVGEGRTVDEEVKGIVFLAVDSMEQRRAIIDKVVRGNTAVLRVIEVRMAASHGNVLNFNPHDPKELEGWIGTLVNDDEAEESACGSSLTVGPTAAILSNIAVWQMMSSLQAPEAVDPKVNIFLVPTIVATEQLK